jgi:Trypsin-like peptidase domain
MSETSSDTKKLEECSLYEVEMELRARERNPPKQETGGRKGMRFTSTRSITSTRKGIGSFSTKQLVNFAKSKRKLIYGVDDRKDYHDLSSEQKKECDSVVSLFSSSDIEEDGNGQSRLQTIPFGDAQNLCKEETFRDQPIGAFCSGFLVAPDIIATAGHCVDESNVTDTCFVFGFRMEGENRPKTTISNSEIYRGKEIIGRKLIDEGTDWCLIKIDRPVKDHTPFNIRRGGKIEDAQKVHVIGHPSGLPLKYAGGAWIRNNLDNAYFVANLDTYGGNSGSCVINDNTGEVEGILVRGDTDFVSTGEGCNVSNVCPTTGCRGEDCTRVTEFTNLVSERT